MYGSVNKKSSFSSNFCSKTTTNGLTIHFCSIKLVLSVDIASNHLLSPFIVSESNYFRLKDLFCVLKKYHIDHYLLISLLYRLF